MAQSTFTQAQKQAQNSTHVAYGLSRHECDKCGKKKISLQRSAFGPAPGIAPPIVHDVLRSPGQPLDPVTRAFMEPRFGHDFSRIRVHADSRAAESAWEMSALSYTAGNDLVFGADRYAPNTDSGRRLLAHELTHVLQQGDRPLSLGQPLEIGPANDPWEAEAERNANSIALEAASPAVPIGYGGVVRLQCNGDRETLRARLQQVRARLAQLRGQQGRMTDEFVGSLYRERQRESLERAARRSQAQTRSETAARSLWGGGIAGERIRRAATASQSGNVVNVSVNIQITYIALSDTEARARAATDIPRIRSVISDVWQVDITSGEYAGIAFRLLPTVTYLPRNAVRDDNEFLIQVRGQDDAPSSGDPVGGTINLAQAHLVGSRVIVVAHELAHLFGFMDTYLTMTRRSSGGQTVERWSVARPDVANRPDLLGLIDPVLLERRQRQGAVTPQDVARQTGRVRVWEEEASTVLRTLGIMPPPPQRPAPESEDFDPAIELDRIQREGEAQIAPIRERRQRAERSLQWLDTVEEIMRLVDEERSLTSRLSSTPSP